MTVGNYTISTIETGNFGLDGGAMFGVVPKPLWSKSYNPGDEANRIPMAARCLLLQGNGKTILVDVGCGNKMSKKLEGIYALDYSKHSLLTSLHNNGVAREDVTDVILTHLHFDHVGGATFIHNGKLEPTFPNAQHYVQQQHFEWAENPTEKDRASFMPENWAPIAENGMLKYTNGTQEIFDGIEVSCYHGHTQALQMVKIFDSSNIVVFPADLFPTSAHIPLPYIMGYDNFPLTTLAEKKTALPQAVEEDWLVVYEHDAFAVASKIHHGEKGFFAGNPIALP